MQVQKKYGEEGPFSFALNGAVYLSSSLQILRALIDYGKAYEWGTTDHDNGPRRQFPASADQAVVLFVMVTVLVIESWVPQL